VGVNNRKIFDFIVAMDWCDSRLKEAISAREFLKGFWCPSGQLLFVSQLNDFDGGSKGLSLSWLLSKML
jgi:hypothetical protein